MSEQIKKPTKKKRTFLLPEETLNKLKKDSETLGISINECLERCINIFDAHVKIKREFRKCPIKYGESGKVKRHG
jgi:hypothetical protein